MKERPILFSAPMVQAILDGQKTVTRRALTPQPEHLQVYEWRGRRLHDSEYRHWCWRGHVGADNWDDITAQLGHACPYGVPGDRLWIREAWGYRCSVCTVGEPLQQHHIQYRADGTERAIDRPARDRSGLPRQRAARPGEDAWDYGRYLSAYWAAWRSPIHMPRWACRLLLEVVSVRVERLHEITRDDCVAEGIERIGGDASCTPWKNYALQSGEPFVMNCASPLKSFVTLWDSLNSARGFPWASNPWVWRVGFRSVA